MYARFDAKGNDGIVPDYHACGTHQASHTDPKLVRKICEIRRKHDGWGSEVILLELEEKHDNLPCSRTVRRHLQKAGLNPAPPGRYPVANHHHIPRAEQPHEGWQTDAAEELRLKGNKQACWLRIVDECSGAFLSTKVFAPARWENVDRFQIQQYLRDVFTIWGLPGRLRTDNGYPWQSSGDFPPEMALWLIGLGIEMIWIPPACPQQNGVVERAQGTGKRWSDVGKCSTVSQLQRRCDVMDRRQRESYPYRDGYSRMETYPELKHTGRKYSYRREGKLWDLSRVLTFLEQTVARRRVDRSGTISIYHRTRYVGKPHAYTQVFVSLDPSGPTWVIADEHGRELRTHHADEITAERIRGLSVLPRKGARYRLKN